MSDDRIYPYPDNPGGTHFENCWRARGHHNCCVAMVEQLAVLVGWTTDARPSEAEIAEHQAWKRGEAQ